MRTLVAIILLSLMFIEFINLAYTDILVRRVYKRVYDGTKKLLFFKKIAWLKANVEQFEKVDQDRVQKIVFHRKLSIYLVTALFVVFFTSLLFGVNK